MFSLFPPEPSLPRDDVNNNSGRNVKLDKLVDVLKRFNVTDKGVELVEQGDGSVRRYYKIHGPLKRNHELIIPQELVGRCGRHPELKKLWRMSCADLRAVVFAIGCGKPRDGQKWDDLLAWIVDSI